MPEFLRHLSSKVDGFIFFNDRSEDETSDILKNTNAIEIKHSVQLLENGAFLSKVEAYKKGKVDPMVSKKVQEIIPLIFPDKKINFILPPPALPIPPCPLQHTTLLKLILKHTKALAKVLAQ